MNNLVKELLRVPGPDDTGTEHSFVNPRQGWIYIANQASNAVSISGSGRSRVVSVPLVEHHGGAHEAMRLLPAGRYAIKAASLKELVVRAIPELIFAHYGSSDGGDAGRASQEWGPYGNDFMKRFVNRHVNTYVGRPDDPFRKEWKKRGGRWLIECGVPQGTEKEPLTAEDAYQYLTSHAGLRDPWVDGLIADEFGNSRPYCAAYAEALDRIFSDPTYATKAFYPYANDLWDGPEGRDLVASIVRNGCTIAWKRYLREQRSAEDAMRFLTEEHEVPGYDLTYRLLPSGRKYREVCPGSIPHLVVCFGYFSALTEQLDSFPHVDYKTWLEMQFNLVANDPTFDGVGGMMTYLSSYVDEEVIRWGAMLFRHYGIEGRTETLGKDPYILTHLVNPDFEEQGKGWDLSPAEQGGIRFADYPGFGWLQGRYPKAKEGDTVIVSRRSADGPNVLSQEIRDLEPGRLYSFRMFAGDFQDLSKPQRYAVTLKIDNVDTDFHHAPARSFTTVTPNCYSHTFGPYKDSEHKAWMNYYYRVFRAKGTTARLTITDWASDDEHGGPIGQELAFNFLQLQPYLPPAE